MTNVVLCGEFECTCMGTKKKKKNRCFEDK